jgi:hypothetical protein
MHVSKHSMGWSVKFWVGTKHPLKFSCRHIGCYIECRTGCLDTNKKQITDSVSKPRDEFIKNN